MQITTGKSSRVLVVDDDEMLNYLLCSFLSSRGLETLSAHSLAEAKARLQMDVVIDLILLDYQLGDGVGMDLFAPSAVQACSNLPPVIMISANAEPEFLEQCFLGGVNDYVIKPINFSLLGLKVEALIKSISMQQLIRQQNAALENFKAEAEREEQIAKFTYEYLLRQNSYAYEGVDVWLQSFAAFSGDMALVKKSPSGSLYFILADATGHGLSAAITIMPVVTIFNSMVAKGFHLQKIVTEINRKLVSDTPADRFVAAILLEINPLQRELSVWNGGMPPLLWVNKGVVKHQFKSLHMALGIMDEEVFDASISTIDLPAEGFLFAYSDGLTEQEDTAGSPFALANVINIIAQQPENLLQELAQQLMLHSGAEVYDDDVSMCIIRPEKMFSELLEPFEIRHNINDIAAPNNHFCWSLKLSGKQLAQCEIPPLCNHFLQQVGVDQQFCQRVFSVLSEMISNAVDHGVLRLSSALKNNSDGFIQYFYEREARLKMLNDEDFVVLTLAWLPNSSRLVVEVEDSGSGYNPALDSSGRGTGLIKKLAEAVEIIAPGNKIRATLR
jgi:two-component system, HptB-dependent secretion and biofilm response regulator